MEYMVVGTDGKDYGPVDVDELKNWVAQNRVAPQTTVKDFVTGRVLSAGEIPGLFSAQPAPPAATPYGTGSSTFAPAAPRAPVRNEDMGLFWWAIIDSVLAVLIFLFLHGLGVIFAAYGVYNAIRCQASGNRFGWLAIVISLIALGIVGVGWMMRIGGTPV